MRANPTMNSLSLSLSLSLLQSPFRSSSSFSPSLAIRILSVLPIISTALETIAMKRKTMKSRKLQRMEFFGPPQSPPPPPPPPKFQFPPKPPLPPPPMVHFFYPGFPPVIVVEGASPTAAAHHHHRSSWAVVGHIAMVVISFLTIYNGLFTCKRNTRGMMKGIATWIAKRKEGTRQRAACKTDSNADVAESQQSVSSAPKSEGGGESGNEVSSTPESKEEESQETEEETEGE
ncbi:hypothetical protein CRG98_044401 [Punica granatum]|uniref:Uncharacterized protein n=2 Tax=Punica granatum TaxID=22663 RepID=A0A2I0HU40_PUNGR|nr:hypothetical protein CRG98_044401 [Punica granatum]